MNRGELTERYNLVTSKEWQGIRQRLLNEIVLKSQTNEPVILQGMLKVINTVDSWEKDFLDAKEKFNREK